MGNGLLGIGFLLGVIGDNENVAELNSNNVDNSEHTNNYSIMHFKRINFMVCEFYLNKTVT